MPLAPTRIKKRRNQEETARLLTPDETPPISNHNHNIETPPAQKYTLCVVKHVNASVKVTFF
uniref:Uncharacterized protein n=1 Tax=Glossina morsitans morsitans TaxID=37546 RepID=A0A1B0FDM5_GLOMM